MLMSKKETIHLAYQSALQMIAYQGQITWSSFNSILAANAFLIAAGVFVLRATIRNGWIVGIVISVAGLVICLVWFFVLKRHFSYYAYYHAWARATEKLARHKHLQMITSGKSFASGALVQIPNGGPLQMQKVARVFRVQTLATLIVFIFGFLYFVLLVASGSGLVF